MSIINGANAVVGSAVGGYEIENSLRFNSADSAYLNRTPASAGNRKTWTWSAWVKRGAIADNVLFSVGTSSSSYMNLRLQDNGGVQEFSIVSENPSTEISLRTSQQFRDPSAWYHFVFALDTTQATSSNRAKLYVNGVQVTAFSSATYPSLNADLLINNNQAHNIGRRASASDVYFSGYMTEVHFIDGQALTPSDFGEYNTDTGVWQPIEYTGSYGTNGFYINFSDNSGTTSTTLGKDYSGNGNNWTPNNFSVTAGSGNDSLVDSPTRYGTDTGAGGEVRGNYATLNPLASIGTYSNGNLDWVGQSSGDNTAASTIGVTSGKWYWEVQALSTSNLGTNGVIYDPSRTDLTTTGGYTAPNGYAMDWASSPPLLKYGGTSTSYGTTITSTSDVVMVALDLDNQKLYFGRNGTWFNSSNPATGTSPAVSSLPTGKTWFATVGDQWGSASSQWTVNFGQRPFAYTAPSGFKALCTQNLPEPTVADGGEYFNALTYTGTGASNSLTGVGFQPDLVWVKDRGNVRNHYLWDSNRGVLKELYSNLTNAESTNTIGLSAFNSDGFTLNNGDNAWNGTGISYVAWNWKANGAGVSNTAGTISSTVSANTTAGFSIVTYTGTGSGTPTVGHGLGVAPSMIFIKSRSNTINWGVGHASAGWSNAGLLNATNSFGGSSYFASTAPTSTVFSIQDTSVTNISGATFVAYCFAPIAGYSAFGSYVGNGSSDGPFVFTNHRPRYLLIKSSSAAVSGWVIYDTVRSTYNVTTARLFANSSGAQDTGLQIDILSNGFKLREAGGQGNDNGVTYIYAAFAENPFKYALAR